MMKRLLFLFFCYACSMNLHAQETVYLNSDSEITNSKETIIEHAVIHKNENGKGYTIDFFDMNGILLRTSQYSKFGKTPNKQILYGKTNYKFFGSAQDSLVCYYRNNLRTGSATFYYADGKKHVECAYKQGMLDGLLLQYYPNDSIKRKDIYKKGIATATTIYSEEGEMLGNSPFYVPPTAPSTDIATIVKEFAQAIKLPTSIWKKAGVWEAFVEITFDAEGKMGKVRVLESNHPGLIKPSIHAATKVFQSKTFKPATMDRQPVRSSIILPVRYRVGSVRVTTPK